MEPVTLMQEEVATISTSISKFSVLTIFFLIISGFVSGQYYNDGGTIGGQTSDTFLIPEFDSNREIATEFVAPFLLITILLQRGLYQALSFTLDTSNIPGSDKKKYAKVRKQSTIMALLISGMMVPTPYFQNFSTYITTLFGSIMLLLGAALFIGILYILYKVVN